MDEDDSILDKLAGSIADGDTIKWEEIKALPTDDPRRRLLEHLQLVAAIADVHRLAVDDEVEAATTGSNVAAPPHIGHVPPPPPADDHGEGLGRWGHLLLRRKIGTGGFGEVYHAHDLWLDHPVALKLLKPEVAKSDSTRILHEARRLARVRHPNVVAVHGADMHQGRIGFWMDLIEGDTLDQLILRGRLSPSEAAIIGREICLALAAVHGANLVHRDVKAQNVMRTSDGGRIILMDFGAGEFMDRPPTDGRLRGTPLYLAPEIFDNAGASIATDVYAAGVLLYHLVTNAFPVSGSSIEHLASAHKQGTRRRLSDVRPDLPESFVTVVDRAIHPDPRLRFASAGEMYTALGGEARTDKFGLEPTAMQKALRVVAAFIGVLVATELLGLLGSRLFEATLRIDPAFSAGLARTFRVGINVLVPFSIVWALATGGYAALVGLGGLVWPRAGVLRERWSRLAQSVDPTTVGALIVCFGVVGIVGMTWQFYDVYQAITALALDPRPENLDLSLLGMDGRLVQRFHSQLASGISFVLGVAVFRWFPRLERRAADPSRVRTLRWAAAVVAFLVVAMEGSTHAIIWDRHEVVSFGNQRAFVIGTSRDELLLYTPAKGERKYFRVPIGPDVRRNVESRQLFVEADPK